MTQYTRQRSVGYLGWSGNGNLGDDALHEVVANLLPGTAFVSVAHTIGGVAGHLLAGDVRGRATRPLVLGGGTAVGRANWRAVLAVSRLVAGGRRHLVGVGVEDPAFQGRNSFSGPHELARWRRPLAGFERVTVRGPRSAALLAEVGVDATVVGDPALLLTPPAGLVAAEAGSGPIAVSLGYGDDLWGHDHEALLRCVTEAARSWVADGHRIRCVVLNDTDLVHAEQLAAALPTGSCEIVRTVTTAEFFVAVSSCRAMVSERLHAGVLAAAAGVPVVMLEYQPKCRDFMESVGLGDQCLRVDRVRPAELVEAVVRAAGPDPVARMNGQVAALRSALREEVALLAESVLGAPRPVRS
jgi:hypothetical protein